jgi:CheY-specific phosphatase CheX
MIVEEHKFTFFCDVVNQSFQKMVAKYTGGQSALVDPNINPQQRIAVIIGVIGGSRGRIVMTMERPFADNIAAAMNEEPMHQGLELFMVMAEFANIFCGNAITRLNNNFQDSKLRLTPPVILVGDELDISTPEIQSVSFDYDRTGTATINIGFEGE